MRFKHIAIVLVWLLSLVGVAEAQLGSKLSDLPAITTPADGDLLYLVKPGAADPDRKWTIADLKALMSAIGGGAAFDTCAELAAILTDETGSGACVFANSPSFNTQITTPKVVWAGSVYDFAGSGSPEGVVTAAIGSTYRRTDGGAITSFYVKESGSGNTGWVAYGNPAGSGAPTTVPFITTVADGGVSAEFALGSLATGLLRNTTTTGIPTIATLCTHYLDPSCSITNGQLPSTISSKTFDNSNVFNVLSTLFTFQDNSDTTKQGRFSLAAQTTATTSTFGLPVGSTTLLGDSDFSGTHYAQLVRTGSSTYTACRDNIAGTSAPTATDDSANNYCVGSMFLDAVLGNWYRAKTVGVGTATWQNLGATTEVDGLTTIMGRDNSAVAESYATGLKICNTGDTVCVSRFVDATFGPRDQCSPECDARTFIPTNKVYCLYDQEGDACALTVDPDAASKNAMYQFGTNYKPIASIAVPLTERGAVTIALASIVSNQPKDYYATVTDADTDAVDFVFPITKRMEGATTATVRLIGTSDNAAPSGNIGFHCAMKAYRPGTDTFAAHDTTGEVAVTLTPATQNRPVGATSSAITINGTVADGGIMMGSCEVSAANTTSAQLTDFFLTARAVVQLLVNSWSD